MDLLQQATENDAAKLPTEGPPLYMQPQLCTCTHNLREPCPFSPGPLGLRATFPSGPVGSGPHSWQWGKRLEHRSQPRPTGLHRVMERPGNPETAITFRTSHVAQKPPHPCGFERRSKTQCQARPQPRNPTNLGRSNATGVPLVLSPLVPPSWQLGASAPGVAGAVRPSSPRRLSGVLRVAHGKASGKAAIGSSGKPKFLV